MKCGCGHALFDCSEVVIASIRAALNFQFSDEFR